MEILNQFGFDLKLFFAQIVNFLVIAYIFKRFLYKPLLETLHKRNATIKKGLKDAQLATEALDSAEQKKEEVLKKAGQEAERIIDEAKLQAQSTREDMMEETKQELTRMLEGAKEQIQLEKENFQKEAKDASLEISKKVLQTVLADLFDEKEQDILIKKSVQKLKNVQ